MAKRAVIVGLLAVILVAVIVALVAREPFQRLLALVNCRCFRGALSSLVVSQASYAVSPPINPPDEPTCDGSVVRDARLCARAPAYQRRRVDADYARVVRSLCYSEGRGTADSDVAA